MAVCGGFLSPSQLQLLELPVQQPVFLQLPLLFLANLKTLQTYVNRQEKEVYLLQAYIKHGLGPNSCKSHEL